MFWEHVVHHCLNTFDVVLVIKFVFELDTFSIKNKERLALYQITHDLTSACGIGDLLSADHLINCHEKEESLFRSSFAEKSHLPFYGRR